MRYKRASATARAALLLTVANTILIILLAVLTLTSCNSYELEHISDPFNGSVVYTFRDKKGVSKSIVDTAGRFEYGMKKITIDDFNKLRK